MLLSFCASGVCLLVVIQCLMKLGRSSFRKTLYASHSFSPTLFQLNGHSLFRLNQPDFAMISLSQSCHCCQAFLLLAAVNCYVSAELMRAASTPFCSIAHHIQHLGFLLSPEPSLHVTSRFSGISLHPLNHQCLQFIEVIEWVTKHRTFSRNHVNSE